VGDNAPLFYFSQVVYYLLRRKATRAALLLLPLLGANNFLSIIYPPTGSWFSFAVWSYVTQFLVSFQGFFISLLYCFFNSEVLANLFANDDE